MRKLAAFALSLSAAVFGAQYLLPVSLLLPFGGLCALLAVLFAAALRGEKRLRFVLIALGAAVGLVWCHCYTQVFYAPAQALDRQTLPLTATVADYPQETAYGVSVLVRVETDSGVKVSALLYADAAYSGLGPGDRITTVASCRLSNLYHGEEVTYYTAKGVFLVATAQGDMTVEHAANVPLRYVPAVLAGELKAGVARVFPADVTGLITALTTGDKTGLSDAFSAALSRDGLSHVVAVSGMHLSILVSVIVTLLGKNRRRSAVVGVVVMVLFMGIAGNTPSVVRSCILQLFILAAPLLKRERDSVTALSAALMLLLVQNPFAAMSVGLQLSFASVAGILLLSDRLAEPMLVRAGFKREKSRLLRVKNGAVRFVIESVSVTLGALVFTLPLCVYYFGVVSLIAPLSNLLTLWAVSPAFSVGLLAGALGAVSPVLGQAAALLALPFARYLMWVIPLLAKVPFSAITMDSVYYQFWLLFVYAVLCLALLWRKGGKRPLIPVCACAALLAVAILLTNLRFSDRDLTVSVLDVGQGESVLLRAGDYVALIDCGGSGKNAGDVAADYLQNTGRSTLDLLVMTHFHSDHANGVEELLERIEVSALAVPAESDAELYDTVLDAAEKKGVEVWTVSSDTTIPMGETGEMVIFPPLGKTDENEEGLSVLCTVGDFDAIITGDMGAETEMRLMAHTALPDAELLVVGHHGSRYSTSVEFLDAIQPELAIISVGYNTYGHPADSVLERLDEAGAAIYRTDKMGTVTVSASAFDQD